MSSTFISSYDGVRLGGSGAGAVVPLATGMTGPMLFKKSSTVLLLGNSKPALVSLEVEATGAVGGCTSGRVACCFNFLDAMTFFRAISSALNDSCMPLRSVATDWAVSLLPGTNGVAAAERGVDEPETTDGFVLLGKGPWSGVVRLAGLKGDNPVTSRFAGRRRLSS